MLTKKTWNAMMKIQVNLEMEGALMEKNKILEAARNNKYGGKEIENQIFEKSNLLSSACALLIGFVLFLVEFFAKNSVNIALLAVGMTAVSVQSLYEGVKTKKRTLIVFGSVCGVLAVVFVIASVMQAVIE